MIAMLMVSVSLFAKDIKVAVFSTNPQMHCAGCENRIKNGLMYEKGIKDIETSIEDQTVTITYDADVISIEAIQEAFGKLRYKVEVIKNEKKDAKK